MRKQDSFFNEVAAFINSIPVGETFTSAQYINAVGDSEKTTRWKIISRNTNYRAHQYKGMLRPHFLQHIKRGTWKVTRHIPEWFTTAHLWTLNGYANTYTVRIENDKYHFDPTPRSSMTRDEIIAKLEAETNIDVLFHKMANSIADESVIGKAKPEDPMYYASGAYVVEKAIEGIPVFVETSEIPQVTITKISQEQSLFFANGETETSRDIELMNSIRENVGLVRAATHIMDQVRILDPHIHGRSINIFEQLKSLLIVLENKIVEDTPKRVI